MAKRRLGAGTVAVHAGEGPDAATGSVAVPIHQTSTFLYPQRKTAEGRWVDAEWLYTRYANPTLVAVEQKLAALEGAPRSLTFATGMAAMAAAILAPLRAGQRIATQAAIYGGTQALLAKQAPRLGFAVDREDSTDAGALADRVTDDTGVVVTEIPSNPFNRVLDLPALAKRLAQRFGRAAPPIACDATFATPLNFRPLENGARLSMHSATKYLNGHSDLIGGAVSGAGALMDDLESWRRGVGASMDPHQGYLLGRGMKTLEVRLRRAEKNAAAVAQTLSSSRKVKAVWHLSLKDHPDYATGRRLLDGPGAIVTFELAKTNVSAAHRFVRASELFLPAPSLGGVESLVSLPVETSHAGLSAAERKSQGISPGTIRLAVGIETTSDLVADVHSALRAV